MRLLLLAACLIAGRPLTGYSTADWIRIAVLTVVGQLMGHSIFNFVLRSISPTIVSLGDAVHGAVGGADRRVGARADAADRGGPGAGAAVAGTAIVISARERAPAEAT